MSRIANCPTLEMSLIVKRPASPTPLEGEPSSKRSKTEIVSVMHGGEIIKKTGIVRTSSLQAPTMLLEGHAGSVNSIKFDASGQHICSGSYDRTILLWEVYGECKNYAMLKGHKNAILDVQWSPDSSRIISASADKTLGLWDSETQKRIRRIAGHEEIVNSCSVSKLGGNLVVSGSNDCRAFLWDQREREPVQAFDHDYPITAVALSYQGDQVFTGGIDNEVYVWDTKKGSLLRKMSGHADTITSLSLSPTGSYLLSNSMDNTLKMWDVKPFCEGDRCVKTFVGAMHSADHNLIKGSFSPDESRVCCGSGDRMVYIWDAESTKVLYRLPGHTGCVNEVVYHPIEPIIASGGADKVIYLGEIEKS